MVGVPSVWSVVMLPLTVKLRALQGAQEARAADAAARRGECDGYAVWDEDGRVGTVARTRPSRSPVPHSTLAARVGLFRRRVVLISATEVDRCDSDHRRVTLKPRAPRTQPAVVRADDASASPRPDLE